MRSSTRCSYSSSTTAPRVHRGVDGDVQGARQAIQLAPSVVSAVTSTPAAAEIASLTVITGHGSARSTSCQSP